MIAYTDNILIIAESRNQALDHSQALVHLLEYLDFIINTLKSVLTPNRMAENHSNNKSLVILPPDSLEELKR